MYMTGTEYYRSVYENEKRLKIFCTEVVSTGRSLFNALKCSSMFWEKHKESNHGIMVKRAFNNLDYWDSAP